MILGWKIIVVVVAGMAVASAGRADPMPWPAPAPQERCQEHQACRDAHSDSAHAAGLWGFPIATDLNPLSVTLLPGEAETDIVVPPQGGHIYTLSDERGSVTLCLYALLSLGLYKSALRMRRLSPGIIIPDWYHHGGPVQIGHSYAVAPDCLCSVPVYCFIQPTDSTDGFLPQYYQETAVSFWRKSQFTPAVIAARGPPGNLPLLRWSPERRWGA